MSFSSMHSTSSPVRSAPVHRPLRVVLLESSADDAALIERALADLRSDVIVRRTESEEAFEREVAASPVDALLVDRILGARAPGAFARLRALRPAAPLIFLARALDEDTVVALVHEAPDDVVLKSNPSRLVTAIERGITARRALAELSPRQLEVLVQVAEGRSTREIAEMRGLSIKTVESHRGAMMKRLSLHDVAGLVRYAVRMGLVRADGFYPAT